jgi:hypothetical protein
MYKTGLATVLSSEGGAKWEEGNGGCFLGG